MRSRKRSTVSPRPFFGKSPQVCPTYMVFLLKAEAACFVLAPGNPIDLSKYSLEGIFRQVNIFPGCLVGLPALDGKTNKNATCPEAGYIHRGGVCWSCPDLSPPPHVSICLALGQEGRVTANNRQRRQCLKKVLPCFSHGCIMLVSQTKPFPTKANRLRRRFFD